MYTPNCSVIVSFAQHCVPSWTWLDCAVLKVNRMACVRKPSCHPIRTKCVHRVIFFPTVHIYSSHLAAVCRKWGNALVEMTFRINRINRIAAAVHNKIETANTLLFICMMFEKKRPILSVCTQPRAQLCVCVYAHIKREWE